jgi:hypothetical protein
VHAVRLTARLNACVAAGGRRARGIVRPTVARLLGRGSLKSATAAAQGSMLPAHLIALLEAGIDSVIVRPLPGEGVPMEDTIARLGEIWHGLATTAT